jgi:hypothetical protein
MLLIRAVSLCGSATRCRSHFLGRDERVRQPRNLRMDKKKLPSATVPAPHRGTARPSRPASDPESGVATAAATSPPSPPPPPSSPRLLDRLRGEIRARHYSLRTERAYVDWVRRFILFHGKRRCARSSRTQGRCTTATCATGSAQCGFPMRYATLRSPAAGGVHWYSQVSVNACPSWLR